MGILLYRLQIVLNDRDMDSTDYHIASVLLMNMSSLCKLSIGEVAKLCNVSKSTISKFIRDLYFEDYAEFKAAAAFRGKGIGFNVDYNQNVAEYIEKYGYEKYLQCVQNDILSLKSSLTMQPIEKLAKYLLKYEKVATFGLLFSEVGALDLQMKLGYNDKFIVSILSDAKQDAFIHKADENTLIIIYSNSGSYLERYPFSTFQQKKDYSKIRAKICLITGNAKMKEHPKVDLCISFPYNSELQSYSEIYPLINDRIVMEYRNLRNSFQKSNF